MAAVRRRLQVLLYVPGVLLYAWAKHQRQERMFTPWEWAILAALVVLELHDLLATSMASPRNAPSARSRHKG